MKKSIVIVALATLGTSAFAFTSEAWLNGTESASNSLSITDIEGFIADMPSVSNSDLIAGAIGTERLGDTGWHPANTNPADQLPALTDGAGRVGLAGLLNDFPPVGLPTKLLQYDFALPVNIQSINVFSGNGGADGRVFHTYVVRWSTDNGSNWSDDIYVQSSTLGSLQNGTNEFDYTDIYSSLSADSGFLASAVTNLQFDFYGVDNGQGQYRDPFEGVNPFTGINDGMNAPNTSPIINEIDVIGQPVPEPATMLGLGAGLAALAARRRRK
ncbi:MAG: PEP-CTERM sorting domain-containing protein [Fimbriimonadaceae bacterium]